jgi:hypothetical protein
MGIEYAKDKNEMNLMNQRFFQKVKQAQSNMLQLMAEVNLKRSRSIVETHNFKGTLLSSITTEGMGGLKVSVLASADHAYAIEEGEPEKRGYVTFAEQPLLEEWVREKLLRDDPGKADYFLYVKKAVLIGMKGFPYGWPKGLQFMYNGFQDAVIQSDMIISEELAPLGC